jgi:hypothetical protein
MSGCERVVFDLPWPWSGDRFELRAAGRLNYIIGPLGSGKTRLAFAIAERLPDTSLIGLERLAGDGARAKRRMRADRTLRSRVNQILDCLTADGARSSSALISLLVELESAGAKHLVVDMVEQGLDRATQQALVAHLRQRRPESASLFLLTRSNAILDLSLLGPHEAIILCPPNHSTPMLVVPHPGEPGYESVSTCLASPGVCARNESAPVAPSPA